MLGEKRKLLKIGKPRRDQFQEVAIAFRDPHPQGDGRSWQVGEGGDGVIDVFRCTQLSVRVKNVL